MLNKLFKKEDSKKNEIDKNIEYLMFQRQENEQFKYLVLLYFIKNGINPKGTDEPNVDITIEEALADIDKMLKVLEYTPQIELLILDKWKKYKELNPKDTPSDFAPIFINELHNHEISEYVHEDTKERNKMFIEAYNNILICIRRIQGWLGDEDLRQILEADLRNVNGVEATMMDCLTHFCNVSLGCSRTGNYNIVYSVDYRFQEMIGNQMASTLIRRINEFTAFGEAFVYIGSLYANSIENFNKKINDPRLKPYYKLSVTDKHTLEE